MSNVDPFEEYGKAYIGDKINPDTPSYITNRIFSFDYTPEVHKLAMELSIYQFHVDNEVLYKAYEWLIPKQQPPPHIKYIQAEDEKESEFDFLIKKLKTHYGWTESDLKVIKPLLISKLEDKAFLEKALRFVGAEKSKFEKYNIDYTVDHDNTVNEGESLDRWFN